MDKEFINLKTKDLYYYFLPKILFLFHQGQFSYRNINNDFLSILNEIWINLSVFKRRKFILKAYRDTYRKLESIKTIKLLIESNLLHDFNKRENNYINWKLKKLSRYNI